MLSHTFLEWWFTPWSYAVDPTAYLPLATDRLAQRDGYRLWCEQANITPDLPENFDPAWSDSVCHDSKQLIATARLFAGLMAARGHEHKVLDRLCFSERKWCVGIAATQPLQRCQQANYSEDDAIETRGLVELAYRLNNGFPDLWPRLRLMLPTAQANRIDHLLETATTTAHDSSMVRAQRCWRLCRNHAVSSLYNQEKLA